MPRFYFDLDDNGGELSIDAEGIDLPDFETARREAISVLPNIARDQMPASEDRDFRVRVRNASGVVVFRASLVFRSEDVSEKTA